MIIFAKEDGRVESSPAFIPKGSGGVPVQVFAPCFARQTCEVWVTPPSGLQLDPVILSPEFGGRPGVWAGNLPPGAASSDGRGFYQLRFTSADGTVAATLSGTYQIQRGIVDAWPERMDDLSGYSLKNLAILLSQIANTLDDYSGRLDDYSGRLDDYSGRLDDYSGRLDDCSGRLDDYSGRLDDYSKEMITGDNLPQKMEDVTYNMNLSNNILSWGISGKALASVLLTGLIGMTGCVFSEKENRESLATIVESVPIIAETESEAAEINTVRQTLAETLRADEPEILESLRVSLDGLKIDTGTQKYRIYAGYNSPFKTYEDVEKEARISVDAVYTKGGLISREEPVSGWEVVNGSSPISETEPLRVSYGGKFGEAKFSLEPTDSVVESTLFVCGKTFSTSNDANTAIELAAGTTFETLVRYGLLYCDVTFEVNGTIRTDKDDYDKLHVLKSDELSSVDSVEEGEHTYLVVFDFGGEALAGGEIAIKSNPKQIPLYAIDLSLDGDPNAEHTELDVYSSCRINTTWLPAAGSGSSISFSAIPEGYATIARPVGDGSSGNYKLEVTVNAYPPNGDLTIVAAAPGSNVMSTFKIQVPEYIPVTGVVVSQEYATLTIGDTLQLAASVEPSNATHREVVWALGGDYGLYATVSENGLVTIKSYPPDGFISIVAMAKYQQNIVGSCYIEVVEGAIGVTGITLSKTSATLKVGESLQLTATVLPENAERKDIKWYSNSDAVTVENGLVTAIALPGGSNTAIITAQSLSTLSVTASCTFEIQPVLVESITITPSTLSMKVGETAEVSYSFTPANATNPSFEVNVPPEIEVVSHDTANRKVVVKAISEGSVEFAITDSDNYSVYATCQVTVEAVVASNYWASDAVTGGQLPSITFPISDFSASDFEKINYIDITGDKLGTAALGTEISVLRLFRSDSGWDTKEVWRANQSAAGNDIVKSVGFNNGISVQTTNYIFGNAREYTLTCYDDPTSLPVANIDEAYDNGLFNQVGGNSTTFKIMARRNGGLIKQAEGFTSIVIAEDESALSPSYNETNNLYNNKLTLTKSGETWGGVAETSLGNKTVSSATVEVSEDELFGNSVLSVSVKVITSSGGTTDLKFINANKYIGTIVIS